MKTELQTGNATVDAEHRQLLAALGRLRQTCEAYDSKASCDGCEPALVQRCEDEFFECLGDLIDFTLQHFRTEEALMRQLGVPQRLVEAFAAHLEDHADLSEQLARLTGASGGDAVNRLAALARVTSDWMERHIIHHDLPMLCPVAADVPRDTPAP